MSVTANGLHGNDVRSIGTFELTDLPDAADELTAPLRLTPRELRALERFRKRRAAHSDDAATVKLADAPETPPAAPEPTDEDRGEAREWEMLAVTWRAILETAAERLDDARGRLIFTQRRINRDGPDPFEVWGRTSCLAVAEELAAERALARATLDVAELMGRFAKGNLIVMGEVAGDQLSTRHFWSLRTRDWMIVIERVEGRFGLEPGAPEEAYWIADAVNCYGPEDITEVKAIEFSGAWERHRKLIDMKLYTY